MTNPAAPDYQQLAQPAWSDHARRFPPAGTPADPDFHAGGTWPWDWSTMTRDQAERMWNRLEGFVAYLNDRYAWDHDQQIPMCWAFHGALVEELTTLYWSRWAAFCGPDANPDKAQAWHTYFLPPFYGRMATWCGGAQNLNKCQSGNHVPARRNEGTRRRASPVGCNDRTPPRKRRGHAARRVNRPRPRRSAGRLSTPHRRPTPA